MSNPRVLIVQTGTAAEQVRAAHGDYPDWFSRALANDAEFSVLRAHEGERLDAQALSRHKARGILVTGSPLSVTERAPWMEELGAALLRQGKEGTQVLGVCFGEQLLGVAAGGDVIKNPRGREIGTVKIQLTPAGRRDPLFRWADASDNGEFEMQATHVDAVSPLPPGATLLASNENTASQAFRLSETVAGVQFHPELSPEAMRDLISSREEALKAEGLNANALRAAVRPASGKQLLRAWIDQVRKA